jgi:choline kinase
MEIIKHGDSYIKEREDIKYNVRCEECGCEFIVNIYDLNANVTDRGCLAIEVKCPECYSEVYTDIEKESTKENLDIVLSVYGITRKI